MRTIRFLLSFLLLVGSLPAIAFAQATATVTTSAESAVDTRKAELQSELDALNTEIDQQQTIITQQENQQQTLQGEVTLLTAQIKDAQLSIQATNLEIEQLTDGISSKQVTVTQLSAQLQSERNSLADLLRQTNDIDSDSLVEVVLSGQSLSQFFSDLDDFSSIKSALQDSYTQVTADASSTQAAENALEDQKTQQSNLLQIQQLQKTRLTQEETQKNQLIAQSKTVEKQTQVVLNQSEKSAATIRAELFTLNGSAAIPFGTALQYADEISIKTGVRPAFLLGIIAEESDLGANIGTGNWRTDMKSPRDTVPFQQICAALGLNPDLMPVSKKPWYGWGGAMGPAQFIPSTWVLYEAKVSAVTGNNPPNPWNPLDAFAAAGILLKENGASDGTHAGTASQERLAAERYLAGWANASNPAYSFYGNDVMSLASNFQQEIDILNQ